MPTGRIPSKANRKTPIPHDIALYRQRHRIENKFGKLKDWRRIHTRCDRCTHTFMSAICIAATRSRRSWSPRLPSYEYYMLALSSVSFLYVVLSILQMLSFTPVSQAR